MPSRHKTYQLKLTSATELEKFLEKLEAVKVDLFSIVRLHHTDIEKIKLDLKIAALQAARSKAEVMLKSIGSSVGKPLMIREWDQDPIIQPMQTANVYMVQRSQGKRCYGRPGRWRQLPQNPPEDAGYGAIRDQVTRRNHLIFIEMQVLRPAFRVLDSHNLKESLSLEPRCFPADIIFSGRSAAW